MLKIQDKDGKTRWTLSDEDEEPVKVEDVVEEKEEEKLEEEKNGDNADQG